MSEMYPSMGSDEPGKPLSETGQTLLDNTEKDPELPEAERERQDALGGLYPSASDGQAPGVGDTPDNIAEMRAQGPQALYDDAKRFQSEGIEEGMESMLDRLGVEEPDRREGMAAEWRRVFGDMALRDGDAGELVGLANQALKEGGPGQEGALEARAELRQRYGKDGAQRKLADAQALAQRDPRLADFLEKTGLSNHPRVVELMADRAQNERTKGRL